MATDYDLKDMEWFQVQGMTEPIWGAQVAPDGTEMRVHPRSACETRDAPCVIHKPSDHHMRDWPLNFRGDTGVMERICPHGWGHPDPDHMAYVRSLTPEHKCPKDRPDGTKDYTAECIYPHLEWHGSHGCDFCCQNSG